MKRQAKSASGGGVTTPVVPKSVTTTSSDNSNEPMTGAATPSITPATTVSTMKSMNGTTSNSSTTSQQLMNYVWFGVIVYSLYRILFAAYDIRLGAIKEYGPVIHEFDPYFNYRATEYLYWNGAKRFFQWFDYQSWYPLGRPVGTTIYPGMQFTAIWIKKYLLDQYMTLNDICCYMPAWFGVIATILTGFIAYECSLPVNTSSNIGDYAYNLFLLLTTGNGYEKIQYTKLHVSTMNDRKVLLGLSSPATEIGLVTMAMMSIVPAHLMRSIGGGYDNESVAVTAMVLTFFCWVRSLRTNDPYGYLWGIATGFAYFYMVAAWGGYVFVLNLIGIHAAILVLLGRFNTKTIYWSYTLFYSIGTLCAMQIPVVGYSPIKSLEQLGPCVVFIGYQLLYITESMIQRNKGLWTRKQNYLFRMKVITIAAVVAIVLTFVLLPTGYFGPLSSRVRGLFVKHTKTGNPLVDSVAEHQPASSRAYYQYLHNVCHLAPFGFLLVLIFKLSDSSSFLLVWGTTAYFFSHKMVRLILLTAPIASVLGGICGGRLLVWCIQQWWSSNERTSSGQSSDNHQEERNGVTSSKASTKMGVKKIKKNNTMSSSNRSREQTGSSFDGMIAVQNGISDFLKTREGVIACRCVSIIILFLFYIGGVGFTAYCWRLQIDLSNPSIIVKARTRDNTIIMLDDYREAYWWLRDNTPEDSRIMAWWDYGYQISAIANRTTIADGNTWNHEHIALLGKALTTDLESGWEIARHLADYLLLWGGGGGDDLAKSPHLARIANSVYRDHCPDDPTCRAFGFLDRQGTPSTMMKKSLLYNLHGHQIRPEVNVSEDRFQEVYRSKYGKVRIYKISGIAEESKAWVADPKNRKCDAPGSWFCPGQYPPGLKDILSRKTDFKQLEDFNRRGGDGDNQYQEQYFKDLQNPEGARRKMIQKEKEERIKAEKNGVSDAEKKKQLEERDAIYNRWSDTADTTAMWQLINSNDYHNLKELLNVNPNMAFVRSKDGRGPMWWAYETQNEKITQLLQQLGVPSTDVDVNGLSPMDLLGEQRE